LLTDAVQQKIAFYAAAHRRKRDNCMQSKMSGVLREYRLQVICIVLVVFGVFGNSISNSFNIDDIYYTTPLNQVTGRGIAATSEIFSSHSFHDNTGNVFDYRPIPMLTFAIQHQAGLDDPHISHFINVALYALVCVLLFQLLIKWLGVSRHWLAFTVVVLYAVHPLHTEIVDSIKNRDELLATFFGVLSMHSLWLYFEHSKLKDFLLSTLLLFAGLLCKTTVIVFVSILPVALYFFSEVPMKRVVIYFSVFALVGFILIGGVTQMLPDYKRTFLFFENPLHTDKAIPFSVTAATGMTILGWYAWLHVFPHPLSFYYGYSYVHLFNWSFVPVISVVFHVLLLWIAFRGIRVKSLVSFGILVYLICIVPFSNLVSPAPGMMAERFTNASSLGYCFILATLFHLISGTMPGISLWQPKRKTGAIFFVLFFMLYSTLSVVRNTQWKDTWILYSHDVQHLQNSVKVNMLYAEQLMFKMERLRFMAGQTGGEEQKKYTDSIVMFQKEQEMAYLRALDVWPYHYEALANLGVGYINMDSFEKAIPYLSRARTLAVNNAHVHENLGIAFARLGVSKNDYLDSAINEFKQAQRINPKHAIIYSNIVLAYLNKKDTTSAINMLNEGLKQMSDEPSLYMELGQICFYRKDTAGGIKFYERGVQVARPEPVLLQALVNYYHSKGDSVNEMFYKGKLYR